MSKGSVSVTNERLSLILKNGVQSSHAITDLEKFYCLLVGSEVLSNDSICYLLVFNNELWLVPELTPGSAGFRQFFKYLNNDNKAVVATLDYLPYTWRLVMYVLPGLEANLRILNLSEFEKIKNELSIVDNMKVEDAF